MLKFIKTVVGFQRIGEQRGTGKNMRAEVNHIITLISHLRIHLANGNRRSRRSPPRPCAR